MVHLHCPNICDPLLCGIISGSGICDVCARVLLINETVSSQEAEGPLNKERVTFCSFLDDLLSSQWFICFRQNGKEPYITGNCGAHDLKRLKIWGLNVSHRVCLNIR